MDDIKKSLLYLQGQTDLFIKILEQVPDQCIWGLSDISEDIWNDFNGIQEILKFKVNSKFEYGIVIPELYIEINFKSKNTIISFVKENCQIWGYIYHQMIFKEPTGYMVAYENFSIIDISDDIGITRKDVNEYKNLDFQVMISSNVFD